MPPSIPGGADGQLVQKNPGPSLDVCVGPSPKAADLEIATPNPKGLGRAAGEGSRSCPSLTSSDQGSMSASSCVALDMSPLPQQCKPLGSILYHRAARMTGTLSLSMLPAGLSACCVRPGMPRPLLRTSTSASTGPATGLEPSEHPSGLQRNERLEDLWVSPFPTKTPCLTEATSPPNEDVTSEPKTLFSIRTGPLCPLRTSPKGLSHSPLRDDIYLD